MKVREMPKILVVDDEVGIRELLSEILRDEGHDVVLAENATEARTAREAGRPDMVLLDIWMPDTDGITLLKEWSGNGQLNMPVVMMSGHATIDTAVEATRIGALDFLEKPIGMQKLLAAVKKALERGARHGSGGLSLGAFARPGPLRDQVLRNETRWRQELQRAAQLAIECGHLRDGDTDQYAFELYAIPLAMLHESGLFGYERARKHGDSALERWFAAHAPSP